jgi:hypothetical protein
MQMLRSKWTGRVYNGNKREEIVLADPLIRRIHSVLGRQRGQDSARNGCWTAKSVCATRVRR